MNSDRSFEPTSADSDRHTPLLQHRLARERPKTISPPGRHTSAHNRGKADSQGRPQVQPRALFLADSYQKVPRSWAPKRTRTLLKSQQRLGAGGLHSIVFNASPRCTSDGDNSIVLTAEETTRSLVGPSLVCTDRSKRTNARYNRSPKTPRRLCLDCAPFRDACAVLYAASLATWLNIRELET